MLSKEDTHLALACTSPMADDEFVGKEAEEDDGEMSMLLKPTVNGSMSENRQQSSRRKVQWNDCSGNRLTEVLEFEPSDSSDADDNLDDRTFSWEQMILYYIHFCCCLCGQRCHS